MAEDRTLIRLSLALSEDGGVGRGTGEPVFVQPDQDKEYRRQLYALEVYRQFSPHIGAGIIVPYARLDLEDHPTDTENESDGFGDLRLYLTWAPWADEEDDDFFDPSNFTFIVGLTLPTASDALPDLPVGRDGQLGGGSLDVRLAVTYWGNLSEMWAIYAQMSLQLDTAADSTGYRNAASWRWMLGVGFTPVKYVSLYASFRANWSDQNIDPAGDVPNTGGTFWYVGPTLVVRPIDELWFDFQASFLVFSRVNGDQILPGNTYTFGISVNW